MRVVGVVRLPHLGHPNGTFAKNPKPCHRQFCIGCIGCHHQWSPWLFVLLANQLPLAMQCHHTIVEICLYLSKLVFNATFKLYIWYVVVWALRWWSIKIQGASQLDFSCSRVENQRSSLNKHPHHQGEVLVCFMFVIFVMCIHTSRPFFNSLQCAKFGQVVVRLKLCVERFCSSLVINNCRLWMHDSFARH